MNESRHTDELEEYLQQHAGEHKMYPSDRVWKSIRKRIHTPKKWPALSVFTVLIISALVIGTVLNKPQPDTLTANFTFSLQSPANNPPEKNPTNQNAGQQQITDEHYSVDEVTTRTIIAAVEKIRIDEAVAMQLQKTDNFTENNQVAFASATTIAANSIADKTTTNKNDIAEVMPETGAKSSAITNNFNYYLFDLSSRLKSILNSKPADGRTGGAAFFSSSNHAIVFNDLELKVQRSNNELLPSALEKLSKTSSRFDFRFYATPSISYRRLDEHNTQQTSAKSQGSALESNYKVDPSQAINHTPAMGIETGVGLGYRLNKKFTVTGGFQFNISQYKINAFLYKDEPTSVTLDEGNFASTVNTVSSLRSIPGSQPLTIKNRYYQLSMPVGLDWQILNGGRFNWGLAGSLQPTYTFDKQPLIITSNYKNYADGSPYVRNWNVNTNLETYVGYTTGGYRWQVGPQIRYQLLPSLADKYPNKEYLVNYGLKIGVVKHLK
jgi:hypothetical protein